MLVVLCFVCKYTYYMDVCVREFKKNVNIVDVCAFSGTLMRQIVSVGGVGNKKKGNYIHLDPKRIINDKFLLRQASV